MQHRLLSSLCILLAAAPAMHCQAATVIVDDFDSGSASAAWDVNANTTVMAGGALSSSNAITLNAAPNAPGLGESFGSAVPGGAEDFVIDFYLRVQTSTNRQFSLQVSNTNTTVNVLSGATINLRYQSGAFALFTTAWNNVPALGSVNVGDWYHMQVEGIDFGTPAGSYTLRLSDPNGTAFTKTAGGLTFAQSSSVTGALAQSFAFNTAFGTNPGFDVDNISVTAFAPVPEPSSALLGGLALLGFLRRRR